MVHIKRICPRVSDTISATGRCHSAGAQPLTGNIAAPVFDIQQRVPYAVSVSLTTAKLQMMGAKNLTARVVATAQAISEEPGSKV